jgi:hypothetical protein
MAKLIQSYGFRPLEKQHVNEWTLEEEGRRA